MRGRLLFSHLANFYDLEERCYRGAEIKIIDIDEENSFEALAEKGEDKLIPMFIITEDNKLEVCTTSGSQKAKSGQKLIALVSA